MILIRDALVTVTGSNGIDLSKDGLIWESEIAEANTLDGGEGEGGGKSGKAHCESLVCLLL